MWFDKWHETEYGRERLELEMELLADIYPQMNMSIGSDRKVRVDGWLGPNNVCHGSYHVIAEYPDNYPNARIKTWCASHDFPPGTPHLYRDDELCIEHGDACPIDTIVTYLGWAGEWFAAFENSLQTGQKW